MVAPMLVAVADKQFVEQLVDVAELRLVLVGGVEDLVGCEGERGDGGAGHNCGGGEEVRLKGVFFFLSQV